MIPRSVYILRPTGAVCNQHPLDVGRNGPYKVFPSGLWKIGFSFCPESRAADVSISLGWCDMVVYFEAETNFFRHIESELHFAFMKNRHYLQCDGGSEFFYLSGCDILSALNYIADACSHKKPWTVKYKKP